MSKSPKKSKSLTRAGNRPATISAQQTIPYVRMLPDGICQLPGGVYTKTLEYEDINYSVASAEDQTAIFGGWSSWLNYFDSSLPFQLSFVNRRSRSGSRYKVNIPKADDRFNSVRTEYTGMLKNQIAKSNNGIERAKYVTFCIPAENSRLILCGRHGIVDVLIFQCLCVKPAGELTDAVRVHSDIGNGLLGRQRPVLICVFLLFCFAQ